MAYFTQLNGNRDFTEAEKAAINSYVAGQKAAGTTDGNIYRWTVESQDPAVPDSRTTRMWGSVESANGYKDLLASFNPAIPASVY